MEGESPTLIMFQVFHLQFQYSFTDIFQEVHLRFAKS